MNTASRCVNVAEVLTDGRCMCRYTCSTELVGKVVPYTPTHDKHGWPHFVSQGCSNIVHEMSQNSAAAQAGGGENDEAANTG